MDPITDEEAKQFRDVLAKWYGTALPWNITYGMYDVLDQLITSSEQCTRAMHLVPRPWDLSNPIRWAQRQVRQAILRYLTTPEGRHYVICMRTTAMKFRTRFEEASRDL